MGTRGLIFLVLAACSNDQFSGEDASADAAADRILEASSGDVTEASTIEGGPTGFCATQGSSAFFCDDFDTLTPATASFSVTTPASPPAGTFDFTTGKSGQGLVVKATSVLSTAYVTKQVQSDTLHGFTFAVQFSSAVANVQYVRVQAQSSSFVIVADGLGTTLQAKGDSGNAQGIFKPDGKWHVIDVQLANGAANVAVDGAAPVAVPFAAQSSSSSTLDVGVVTPALAGGSVSFDDIALR